MNCYYAWNTDGEIVRQSSSGGIFTALARRTLHAGGRVCGAVMDPETRQVMHAFAEDEASLKPLRGAKYPQSAMGGCYNEIAETLGISHSSVSDRLGRARKKLRAALEGRDS